MARFARTPLKHWIFHWPSLVVSLLCAGTVTLVAQFRGEQLAQDQRRTVQQQLGEAQTRLDRVVEHTFSLSAGLVVLAQVDGDISPERFARHVEAMQSERPQVRNVVAAPDNVVRLVYPLKGNEKVMGLDYRSVPAQWAQVERARVQRERLIFAPVKLVQGGLGVIQRSPVFVNRPGADKGQEHYWGTVSLVADLERFIDMAGLARTTLDVGLWLRRTNGAPGDLIWGKADLADSRDAASQTVHLPGAQWLLLARPKAGWIQGRAWLDPAVLGVALASVLISGLSFALGQRRHLLQLRNVELAQEVERRRQAHDEAEAARARYQSLVSLSSDWLWEQDVEFRVSHLSMGGPQGGIADVLSTLIGQRRWECKDVLPGPDWAAHRAVLNRRESFRNFEYSLRSSDGRIVHISISGAPVFDAMGVFQGYRGTGRDVSDIRKAELALRRSSEDLSEARDRLQALFDAATQVAIIATDQRGRITVFNRGAERMLGWQAAEVLGSSPHRFHDRDEMQARSAALSRKRGRELQPGEIFNPEPDQEGSLTQLWTYHTRSGDSLQVSLTVSEVRDHHGELLGHLGIAVDLSAQLAAQAAEREGAQRLQAVLDSANEVAIIGLDLEGQVTLFSHGAERLLGCTAAQVMGLQGREFHVRNEIETEAERLGHLIGQPVAWHEVFERQAAGLDGGHRRVWTYLRRDNGQRLRVSHTFTRLRNAAGAHIGYLAVVLDIEQYMQSQDALAASNRRLQSVLDSAVDVGILVIALDGKVELFNRGAEALFGYAAHEVIGRSSLLFHDADELLRRVTRLSEQMGRRVHRHELFTLNLDAEGHSTLSHWIYVRKGGERIPGALRFSEMRDREGRPLAYLAICMDISEQVHAQEALQALNAELEARVRARTTELQLAQDELLRTEKLAALGSLVAGVAHELNTPIGNCLTAASTLDERTTETQRAFAAGALKRSALETFLGEADAASQLLLRGLRSAADLVAHFKQVSVDQTSEHRRRFALTSLVEDVLSVLSPQLRKARINIQTEITLAPEIDGYPGALGQLLTNLVLNAHVHAFEGEAPRQIWIRGHALEPGWFELQVQDNGRGMSEDVRRRAFDPFFTTKMGQGGTGLGLNIVYNIATGVLGGQLELKTAPGEGSCFTFRLPLVAPHRREIATAMRAA